MTKDVNHGETNDFYVNLVAPVMSGAYEGYWNMRNAQDTKFGETVLVNIIVPGASFDGLEQAYLALLPQTANFTINGKLVFLNNIGQETLRFTRIGLQ